MTYVYDLVPIMYIIRLVEDKLQIFNTININLLVFYYL